MDELIYDDAQMRHVLREVRTIAMVGASPNWVRPSNFAMKYLQGKGYRVIPLNPGQAGKKILGEICYASVAEIPDTVDMVDIFRNSEAAGAIVDNVSITEFWLESSRPPRCHTAYPRPLG